MDKPNHFWRNTGIAVLGVGGVLAAIAGVDPILVHLGLLGEPTTTILSNPSTTTIATSSTGLDTGTINSIAGLSAALIGTTGAVLGGIEGHKIDQRVNPRATNTANAQTPKQESLVAQEQMITLNAPDRTPPIPTKAPATSHQKRF